MASKIMEVAVLMLNILRNIKQLKQLKAENKRLRTIIHNLQLDIKNISYSHEVYRIKAESKQSWVERLKRLF